MMKGNTTRSLKSLIADHSRHRLQDQNADKIVYLSPKNLATAKMKHIYAGMLREAARSGSHGDLKCFFEKSKRGESPGDIKYIPMIKNMEDKHVNPLKQKQANTQNRPLNSKSRKDVQPKMHKILTSRSIHQNITAFQAGKVLGKGSFGVVSIVRHLQTSFLYACKQISLEKVTDKHQDLLALEIKIQSFLDHPNCLKLYHFYREQKKLNLILELGECSLFDLLRQKGHLNESEVAYYITQVIQALMHLHQLGIIHRDIKPENIMIVEGCAKLADFGWAAYTSDRAQKRKTFCGTLDYVSPQIIAGDAYDQMIDVWSVGVLAYELATGHAPFQSIRSRNETFKKILNVDLKFPTYLSSGLKQFIKRLLMKNPDARMSLMEALGHDWLKHYSAKTN